VRSGLALVRHGRSAHRHRGWIDGEGFRAWRHAYEAAGLDDGERAPTELARLIDDDTLVVASDAPRAMESARLLAPSRRVVGSPLLRELELQAPDLRRLRLPLLGWAVAVGMRASWLAMRAHHPAASELVRVAEAADWLTALAAQRQTVVAVTHASFRRQLALHLVRGGWRPLGGKRSLHHWSAWLFAPPV
jgi:broad specificity phosphatase PhoE